MRLVIVTILFALLLSCKKPGEGLLQEPPPDKPSVQAILTDTSKVPIAMDFEAELIRQGIDRSQKSDGFILYGDIKNLDSLNIYGSHSIKSMKGIECFTNLRSLTAFMIQVDSLDLIKNEKLEYLHCQSGYNMAGAPATLVYLNIKNCKALKYLNCYNNLLTSLDISQSTALIELNAGQNPKLKHLDLSHNLNLEVVATGGCWELEPVNLTNNLKLRELYCQVNYKLTKLDTSIFPDLFSLSVQSCNNLSSLNLGSNPNLDHLNVSSTKVNSLDFHKTPNLKSVNIGGTHFSSLDLSPLKKLTTLDVSFAELPLLNLTSNTELQGLILDGTNITEIDLTHNTKLQGLYCQYQVNLVKLDLRGLALKECFTKQCDKLMAICVDKIPEIADENWRTSPWTKYELCKY